VIHGLGATIPMAIELALRIQRKYSNKIELWPKTSTVELLDDLEPIDEVLLLFVYYLKEKKKKKILNNN